MEIFRTLQFFGFQTTIILTYHHTIFRTQLLRRRHNFHRTSFVFFAFNGEKFHCRDQKRFDTAMIVVLSFHRGLCVANVLWVAS